MNRIAKLRTEFSASDAADLEVTEGIHTRLVRMANLTTVEVEAMEALLYRPRAIPGVAVLAVRVVSPRSQEGRLTIFAVDWRLKTGADADEDYILAIEEARLLQAAKPSKLVAA